VVFKKLRKGNKVQSIYLFTEYISKGEQGPKYLFIYWIYFERGTRSKVFIYLLNIFQT